MDCAQDFTFDEIAEGYELAQPYKIDGAAYDALVSVFGDRSPIHTDEEYAKASGFADRVMHGAILNGFLSHFVGMKFPGKRALLMSVNLNYQRPTYLGDELLLSARVSQKVETGHVLVLQVKFIDKMTQAIVASGRVQISVRD